jgi:ferredoxin
MHVHAKNNMNNLNQELENELTAMGAAVVGFADVAGILGPDFTNLERAVSIAVDRKLNENTVSILSVLQKKTTAFLRERGYRFFCIPPDSDRIKGKFASRLYPLFTHKIAATSAGIGWIGRNGLLISPDFGPRLSLSTVLTDAPFIAGKPIETSMCGDCRLCMEFCPSNALTGMDWSRSEPFVEIVRLDHCKSHKKKSRRVKDKPNCGLCINICPYGRKDMKMEVYR